MNKLLDGVYKSKLDVFDLENADKMDPKEVHSIISLIAAELGFQISNISIWNEFPIDVDITAVPFCWHHDHTPNCDTLLLIYFTDEELTEHTGGRIGFDDGYSANYYNIKSGDCFIVNQHKTLHSVEKIKVNLTKRLCISCSLNGWNNFEHTKSI
jgi:hypothetical protein